MQSSANLLTQPCPDMGLVVAEENRLANIYDIVKNSAADRKRTIAHHDDNTKLLETERLESRNWQEKNELTEKLVANGFHNPRKYLVEYQESSISCPYFGIIGIKDENKRIGEREYLIGRQTLMNGTKVAIVDWRRSEVSRLYYDYLIGEDYLETFNGVEREGVITRRDSVVIAKQVLRRIETPTDTYELIDGAWYVNGAFQTTADTKIKEKDHRLTDIVSLISSDQFRMITSENEGCLLLSGSAGSGKTSVAIHRLSYLQFNKPDNFRQERCIVIVFNRTLRDYLKKTSDDLLGKTRIETFSSWALSALGELGVYSLKTTLQDPYCQQKKNSGVSPLLHKYVKETSRIEPVADLWRFYSQIYFIDTLIPGEKKASFAAEIQQNLIDKSRQVTFSDVSILLRLCQLRKGQGAVVTGALSFYDHLILDEAQDLASTELGALLASTTPKRSCTIAADEQQRILSFIDATGFPKFRTHLQTVGLTKESLSISYRSGRAIMELAAKVSGRPAGETNNPEGVVKFHHATTTEDALLKLRDVVSSLNASDPNSLTAVICKKKTDLTKLHQALAGLDGLSQKPGEVTFDPGILVVIPFQVKGLEFSHVVIWNPSESDYHNNDTDRNLLYVAITRACKELHIVHYKPLVKYLC
jgi:DNA helicase II / ATP-dependent DNA helicase PcrA